MEVCVNIMISWFVLTLELSTRLQNTGQCIYSEWKMLENQSANLCLYVSLKEFSQSIFFCSEKGFQVRTALSLFTVNTPCQLPSHCELWHLTAPNHHTHITIEPIVKCVRNQPIKNAHIYPCNYAGYQNELWYPNLQTVYTNGLDNVKVGCNAGYVYLVQPLSDFPQTKTLNQFKKVDFHFFLCWFSEKSLFIHFKLQVL